MYNLVQPGFTIKKHRDPVAIFVCVCFFCCFLLLFFFVICNLYEQNNI